jgi:glyoxylase-like metal-dependent hydrolase (beta-lactamase superfamily II)
MHAVSTRIVLGVCACVVLAVAWRFAPRQQQRGGTPQREGQITTQSVGGCVSMLAGNGGNIGVSVGSDGVLMIDDEFEQLAPQIQAAIDALAKEPKPPRFLIDTHFHGDHTGGNAVFGRGATVVAQDNVRKRLLEPKGNAKAMPAAGLPSVTFADSVTLHFNGEEIRVTHFPACHTDGDSIVLFTKSNVAHLGDLFFKDRFPYVDRGSGGSVRGLEHAVAQLIARLPAEVKIIPGHGELGTLADLKNYGEMLATCLKVVGDQVAQGKTAQEIVDANLLAKYDAWGAGFINTKSWIETIVAELAGDATARK